MRRTSAVDFTVRGKADDALRLVRGLPGVARARQMGSEGGAPHEDQVVTLRCTWSTHDGASPASRERGRHANEDGALFAEGTVAALVGAGFMVREVRPAGGSLEDVFADLTKDQGA
jgi:hypothetical protein